MPKRKRRHQRKQRPERRFHVWGERRDPPNMQKLGKALISLAQAELERQAQAEHQEPDATEDTKAKESTDDQ